MSQEKGICRYGSLGESLLTQVVSFLLQGEVIFLCVVRMLASHFCPAHNERLGGYVTCVAWRASLLSVNSCGIVQIQTTSSQLGLNDHKWRVANKEERKHEFSESTFETRGIFLRCCHMYSSVAIKVARVRRSITHKLGYIGDLFVCRDRKSHA